MFALTISLSEASRSIGLSETELLVKCRNIGMSIYCCPPPSVDIWRFRSITDDHRFGLVGRIVAKEVGPKGGERPGKRFTVEALPPTFVDSAVFFQLSKKDIETLLYTGLVKSRGFAAAYIATEDNCFSLIETGEPNADEIGLLPRKSMVWGRSGPDLPFEGGYCDEFYGMAKSNTTPSGLDDLTDISFLLGDALLERKEFLGRRQLLEPRQTEDILRVFPELSESIGSDNTANPMPKSLVDLLGTCIKAWSMTEPGSTLKSKSAWIKDALAAKSESSLSG